MKKEFEEGQKAAENFERTMVALFKAKKPPKYKPKKRKKKGKD